MINNFEGEGESVKCSFRFRYLVKIGKQYWNIINTKGGKIHLIIIIRYFGELFNMG